MDLNLHRRAPLHSAAFKLYTRCPTHTHTTHGHRLIYLRLVAHTTFHRTTSHPPAQFRRPPPGEKSPFVGAPGWAGQPHYYLCLSSNQTPCCLPPPPRTHTQPDRRVTGARGQHVAVTVG